jgi:hypothetical protein
MKKALSIIILFILSISCTNEEKFPKSLINKTLYKSPYFICRYNLIVDKNYNFILTTYSIGTLSSADKYIIKGKFVDGNKVIYSGSNIVDGETFDENIEFIESDFGPQNIKYPIVRFKFNYWNVSKGKNDIGIMDFAVPKNGACEPSY